MYEYIKGHIVGEPTTKFVVIECNEIGYCMNISLNTYSYCKDRLYGEIILFIHLAIREDSHILYGFYDIKEREIFKKLISVPGVGANTAMTILSSFNFRRVIDLITRADIDGLTTIKGISQKTAEKII